MASNASTVNAYELAIWDQLISTFYVAFERATVATLEEIASAAGVTSLNGMPVAEFHDRRKRRETEELIADFADTNATAATHVRALLDRLDSDQRSIPVS